MARIKNALTGYFVGPWIDATVTTADATTLELAKWIATVTDDSDEQTEEQGFYDGDGTAETDVISIKKTYSFEGMYDEDDAGMKFIADLEFQTGDARKIAFKQVRTNGDIYFGRATASAIKVTGGDATEYPVFEVTISWDTKPTITPAPAPAP